MKIRHPFFLRLVAFLFSWIIRLWIGTLHYRYRTLAPHLDPNRPDLRGKFIYVFWHENLLLPAYQFCKPWIQVLISQHADGELIAQVCRFLGFGTIRGSTTRGGIPALRHMMRASRSCDLAVVPDGPRGPRRLLQPGLIFLASRTGLPIVPMGIGHHSPWRARSWDRFVLPRLWSRACIVFAPPVVIPPALGREQLESFRQQVESILNQVNDLAERWAESGKWPGNAFSLAEKCVGLGA